MPSWLVTTGTLLLSLTVTFLFNKLVALPAELKKQKEAEKAAEKAKEEKLAKENKDRDDKIAALEAAVNAFPSYRAQSLQIQAELQSTDKKILEALGDIKDNMLTNHKILNERLDRLEDREKNAIRAKLLDEYRLFTDEYKNPMQAWSEMEHHAFFKLVKDYEALDGNDYVHSDVLPAMNRLEVILMSNKEKLLELMQSRRL